MMFDLMKALNKIFGKPKKQLPVYSARVSNHRGGTTRPHDFDAKRKTRRKMADASRKINRRK